MEKNIPKTEVTLLSNDEVENSKILKQVAAMGAECKSQYWTRTPYIYSSWFYAKQFLASNLKVCDNQDINKASGVRPVIKSDNLDEILKGCKIDKENGVEIVYYGEYPSLCEESYCINPDNLLSTSRLYYFIKKLSRSNVWRIFYSKEFNYDGKKIIVYNNEYYLVKPVKFYIDRENNMLISTDVLFNSPLNLSTVVYRGIFEHTELYRFLNNEFIKFLKQSIVNTSEVDENSMLHNLKDEVEGIQKILKELLQKTEQLQIHLDQFNSEIEEPSKSEKRMVKKI